MFKKLTLACAILAALPLGTPAIAQSGWDAVPGADIPAAELAARPGLNHAHVEGVDLAYKPLVGPSLLQDENFYLLTLLEQLPEALKAVAGDPDLAAIRRASLARAAAASAACQSTYQARDAAGKAVPTLPECNSEAMRWTEAERRNSADAIGRLFDRSPALRRLVAEHMRPSGRFHRDAALSDRALLVKAWEEAHAAIDQIIRVYGLGEKPVPPIAADIDSVIYPLNRGGYPAALSLFIWETSRRAEGAQTPWHIPLHYALTLLEANRQTDAVLQLRLQESENRKTFAYLAGVRWSDYPHAAIVVPGWSPEIAFEPLNPGRKVALRTAADLFRARKAPVIIVSGARLRPVGTLWTEAFEMKAYLVKELGIPADRILINPLSRHTHTEIRDNGRMIFRTGAPLDKSSLYISEGQYIGSKILEDRFLHDHGVLPYAWLKRRDFTTVEFLPSLNALQRTALDPMNP